MSNTHDQMLQMELQRTSRNFPTQKSWMVALWLLVLVILSSRRILSTQFVKLLTSLMPMLFRWLVAAFKLRPLTSNVFVKVLVPPLLLPTASLRSFPPWFMSSGRVLGSKPFVAFSSPNAPWPPAWVGPIHALLALPFRQMAEVRKAEACLRLARLVGAAD